MISNCPIEQQELEERQGLELQMGVVTLWLTVEAVRMKGDK